MCENYEEKCSSPIYEEKCENIQEEKCEPVTLTECKPEPIQVGKNMIKIRPANSRKWCFPNNSQFFYFILTPRNAKQPR